LALPEATTVIGTVVILRRKAGCKAVERSPLARRRGGGGAIGEIGDDGASGSHVQDVGLRRGLASLLLHLLFPLCFFIVFEKSSLDTVGEDSTSFETEWCVCEDAVFDSGRTHSSSSSSRYLQFASPFLAESITRFV
jgi:hypothetical protein